MEKQNRYLKEIKFRFRYDTDILGSNIILNDVLNIGLSEHILEGHYQLYVSDLQENVVEIKLSTTESASILLDQFYQSILRLQLDASSLSAIPDFELINQGFQESIRLINPITNEEESPDCIRPEFPILERVCPVITSISPDTVAAGVLGRSLNNIPGEITIRGSGFGDPNPGFRKPHESDVSFYDPDGGFFEAGELEYISWSDTIIRVNVPTRSKNTNTTTSGAQDLSLGASTNKIKLFTKKFDPLTGLCSDTCTIFSQDSLFVHFGMFNDAFSEQFQNIEICSTQFQNIIAVGGERRNLVNRNNLGGYSFYIDTLLYTNPVMQDSIVSQITQGIDFFRCNYKFHFTQVAQGLAPNGISRDAGLAFGTLATTLGMGESISNSCGASVQADNPISQFSIKINAMVLDELAVPDMFGNPTNTKFKFSLTDTFQPDSTYTDSISGFNILLRDFRKIFLHEMGHIIQLRHTNNPNDLMAAGAINTSTREVSANDILGIEHAYLLSKEGTCFGGPMDDWKPCTTSAHSKLSNISDLKIQPNPTNSLLHISPSVTSGEIVIYNLLGAIVCQENFSSVLEDLNINLPSQIQPSTYILVVKNKKGNIVQAGKFIKIK